MAKVSFIIPAFNSEATLGECLDSVFAQGKGTGLFEVLVVDNGSMDRTVAISTEKGARVLDGPGITVAALRNLGARNALGEILAFVDSDCVISENWLRNAVPAFDDPQVGAAGAPTSVPENGTWVQRAWYMHRRKSLQREFVEWLPTENLLVRREIFDKAGGFNESLVTCEDVDLCYRIGKTHKILSDPSLVSVHLGEARTLRLFFKKERWRGKGNLKGSLLHGVKADEIPSLLTPLYGAAVSALFLFAVLRLILVADARVMMATAVLLLFPPVAMAIRTSLRGRSMTYAFPLVILYLVYVAARTASTFSPK